ncbi:MAG: pilin [Candidatus Gracilibacteria bacterium]|nr:pilin [Candidatus Gracilibacteria bacterium]
MLDKLSCFAQALPPSPGLPGDLGGAHGIDPLLAQYMDVESVLGKIINAVIASVGIVALIMIIMGGFWYLTSAGNPEQAKKGGKFIMYAIIGILIITMSYAITFTLISAPRSGWDEEEIDHNASTTSIGSGLEWIGSDWSSVFF